VTEHNPLLRYRSQLRYDAARGTLAVLDARALPAAQWAELSAPEPLAEAVSAGLGGEAVRFLAGYGLALAAHQWAGRPSEARRAAIIQAGAWLRNALPNDARAAALIDAALARADAAILAGNDAEAVLVEFVAAELARADRAAERCGRIAAGLLDERDAIACGSLAGPALAWALVAARAEAKQPTLVLAAEHIDAAALAEQLGVPISTSGATICMLTAARVARDGSAAVAPGDGATALQARASGLPCYLLSTDGPDPDCASAAQLAPAEVVAPAQISAIITHRGIYRPEMIERFLGEGDAPLDIIPLS
jgi:methylthioribose-1-phosphate isomerase